PHIYFDGAWRGFDYRARFAQLCKHRIEVIRPCVIDADVSCGDGAGNKISARLYPIWKYFIRGAPEPLHALDPDSVRAGSPDPRAHGIQEIREIDDFRFTGGVLDDRFSSGESRGHHKVLSARDGYCIEHEVRTS